MNMKFFKFVSSFVCLILILISNVKANENPDQTIYIENIKVHPNVLEEWKYPGRYSPFKAFDGIQNTCFAEGNNDYGDIHLFLSLRNRIKFNEVHIAHGLFDSNYFKQNNRMKKVRIVMYKLVKGHDPFVFDENIFYDKEFNLLDEMKYQKIKFKFPMSTKYISFSSSNLYKGTKYNDTCISDIQFYLNDKRINILGIEDSKKKYVKNIERNLFTMLSDKVYRLSDKLGFVKFFKNGDVKYNDDMPKNYDKSFLGVRKWKVEKSKLYFKYKNKWELVNYYTFGISSQSKSLVIRSIGKKRFNVFCHPFKG